MRKLIVSIALASTGCANLGPIENAMLGAAVTAVVISQPGVVYVGSPYYRPHYPRHWRRW
jgi:hypothetical protein